MFTIYASSISLEISSSRYTCYTRTCRRISNHINIIHTWYVRYAYKVDTTNLTGKQSTSHRTLTRLTLLFRTCRPTCQVRCFGVRDNKPLRVQAVKDGGPSRTTTHNDTNRKKTTLACFSSNESFNASQAIQGVLATRFGRYRQFTRRQLRLRQYTFPSQKTNGQNGGIFGERMTRRIDMSDKIRHISSTRYKNNF